MDQSPKRPMVRYHGGKWLLAPWIISHFPEHLIYVEPFCGGASVLLQKPRSQQEICNDLDGDIVNLFSVLRDDSSDLQKQLEMTPYSREEFNMAYIKELNPTERARRMMVRSWMATGTVGACRESRSGFDISSISIRRFEGVAENIAAVSNRLKGVVIENRPASAVMITNDSRETLHCCDPPYPKVTRSAFGSGVYHHEMTDDDHRDLATVLYSLIGMVVLSGYPCDLYDKELFPDWYRVEKEHLADGAKKRTEVLWLNDAAEKGLMNKQHEMFKF